MGACNFRKYNVLLEERMCKTGKNYYDVSIGNWLFSARSTCGLNVTFHVYVMKIWMLIYLQTMTILEVIYSTQFITTENDLKSYRFYLTLITASWLSNAPLNFLAAYRYLSPFLKFLKILSWYWIYEFSSRNYSVKCSWTAHFHWTPNCCPVSHISHHFRNIGIFWKFKVFKQVDNGKGFVKKKINLKVYKETFF